MTAKNDGGPAFPTTAGQTVYSHGMTLRDWFAGQAMGAFYSSFDARDASTSKHDLKADAELFYEMADAMIAAREALK